jgi:hypothetical protein
MIYSMAEEISSFPKNRAGKTRNTLGERFEPFCNIYETAQV